MLTVPAYIPPLRASRQRDSYCPAAPAERLVASPPCQAALDPFCGAGGLRAAALKPLAAKIRIEIRGHEIRGHYTYSPVRASFGFGVPGFVRISVSPDSVSPDLCSRNSVPELQCIARGISSPVLNGVVGQRR